MIKNVLVVCIGNICRSPMAEALLAQSIHEKNPEAIVHSAGLGALVGRSADPISKQLMEARGIDISTHRARQLSSEMVFGSDLILTMDTAQQEEVEKKYPGVRGRVHRLGKWECYDISDPYRRPQTAFEQALILIEEGINGWHRTLWA